MTLPKTPKVAVFDLGKVLVDFDYSIAARRIAARGKISADELHHLFTHSRTMVDYELGHLTTDQMFREVCRVSGFDGTLVEFKSFFADIFPPLAPMVALHADICRRGIPACIFSNTNEIAVEHIRQNAFFGACRGHVLSFEHGAMKPDARLYEVVERTTGARGSDILYIDDRPENIETGIKRAWQTILHESPDKTRAACAKVGLLEG
jgi:FMN phosphatase YigB (HAD superfamily)